MPPAMTLILPIPIFLKASEMMLIHLWIEQFYWRALLPETERRTLLNLPCTPARGPRWLCEPCTPTWHDVRPSVYLLAVLRHVLQPMIGAPGVALSCNLPLAC